MLKKGLILGAILALTATTAFANGGSFVPPPHGACYIGLAISGDDTNFRTYGTFTEGVPVEHFSSFSQDRLFLNGIGINGEIYAGYGQIYQDHYTLAGELFFSGSSDRANLESEFAATARSEVIGSAVVSTSIHRQYTAGAAIMPGIMLSEKTNFYGRLGYIYSRFKLNDNGFAVGDPIPFGFIDGFPNNFTRNRNGMQLGLGMSTKLHHNLVLRGEFRWERYGTLGFDNLFAFRPSEEVTDTTYGTVNIRPTVKSANVGISYLFHAM